MTNILGWLLNAVNLWLHSWWDVDVGCIYESVPYSSQYIISYFTSHIKALYTTLLSFYKKNTASDLKYEKVFPAGQLWFIIFIFVGSQMLLLSNQIQQQTQRTVNCHQRSQRRQSMDLDLHVQWQSWLVVVSCNLCLKHCWSYRCVQSVSTCSETNKEMLSLKRCWLFYFILQDGNGGEGAVLHKGWVRGAVSDLKKGLGWRGHVAKCVPEVWTENQNFLVWMNEFSDSLTTHDIVVSKHTLCVCVCKNVWGSYFLWWPGSFQG